MRVKIATRGSDLARWQAEHVAGMLRELHGVESEIVALTTRGDREIDPELAEIGGVGLFTAEVDRALLEKSADLAVHSLKDLPVETVAGLELAAIPARAPIEDSLVSADRVPLAKLPAGATLGTSSPRRAAFVRSVRPDLEIVNIRGNVPTRVRKVGKDVAATILARAGLVRLGLEEEACETLGPPELLPAPGQGALGIVVRAGDGSTREIVASLEDPDTRKAVEAERRVLAGIGGGCSIPLGVHARPTAKGWHLSSMLFDADSGARIDDRRDGPDPFVLAEESAAALRGQGAVR